MHSLFFFFAASAFASLSPSHSIHSVFLFVALSRGEQSAVRWEQSVRADTSAQGDMHPAEALRRRERDKHSPEDTAHTARDSPEDIRMQADPYRAEQQECAEASAVVQSEVQPE